MDFPLRLTVRNSRAALAAASKSGSSLVMSADSSAVQVEGFFPKAMASTSVSAISRRARICSSEELANVSMGITRPPLCTGRLPSSRLSQFFSAD